MKMFYNETESKISRKQTVKLLNQQLYIDKHYPQMNIVYEKNWNGHFFLNITLFLT